MDITAIFLTGVGATLVASLLAVGYLKPHLKRILTDLCGTEDRANFWAAFSNLTLTLVPVIFAMHYHAKMGQDTSWILEVGKQLEWALIGLVVSVVTLGIILSQFIPRRPADPGGAFMKP